MQLRYYQADAVSAVYRHLGESPGNPVIEIPTGGGKTAVIARICADTAEWGGRTLVLTSSKELIEQTESTIKQWHPSVDVGVFSAKLRRRDKENQVLVASINSVYRRAPELCGHRPFDLIIVDEAHEIPIDGEGMYRTLLSDATVCNPKVRVIGLTASPFRTTTGYVCSPDHFLNEICYSVSVRELVEKGYLCQLVSKTSRTEFGVANLPVRGGEFLLRDMEAAFCEEAILDSAITEMLSQTTDRKSVLVFAAGTKNAQKIAEKLEGQTTAVVTGKTATGERDKIIEAFRKGEIRFLINVNCLTTGFDARNVDCVVLLRSTMSPGLYYQMVGRGLRILEGKANCLILDFGENIAKHGPIDNLRIKNKQERDREGVEVDEANEPPVKVCSECRETVPISIMICPECGALFPPPKPRHEAFASDLSPLGETETQWDITEVKYFVHQKKGSDEDSPKTMRVSYLAGFRHVCDEYVCVEHSGYAWNKAFLWWQLRTDMPIPGSASDAVDMAKRGELKEPCTVWTKTDENGFRRISRVAWGYVPRDAGEDSEEDVAGDSEWARTALDLFSAPDDDTIPF